MAYTISMEQEEEAESSVLHLAPNLLGSSIVTGASDLEYKLLESHTAQIRLIKLLPDDEGDGRIRCETHVFDLSDQPSFVALSYAWGSPPAHHAVELDGEQFFIRKNLFRFLANLKTIKTLRDQFFWIDAICINQGNDVERTHQVNLMPQIYKSAHKVLVWLGPAYNDSVKALRWLSKTGSSTTAAPKLLKTWSQPSGRPLSDLCTRPYWRRQWICQEIMLARQISIMCGDKVAAWEPFRHLVLSAINAESKPRLHDNQAYFIAKESPAAVIVAQIARDFQQRSLFDLIVATRKLRCAEVRDKVYSLIGVATTGAAGIVPDYTLPLPVLLNDILRKHCDSMAPESEELVWKQCAVLTESIAVHQDLIFTLSDRYDGAFQLTPPLEVDLDKLQENRLGKILWASFYRHKTVLKSYFSTPDSRHFTTEVLRVSVDRNRVRVVEILADLDNEWRCLDGDAKMKALIQAAQAGRHRLVRAICGAYRVKINRTLRLLGHNALHLAAQQGHVEVVTELLATGKIDVNRRSTDKSLMTALHYAAQNGHATIVSKLLATGQVDANMQDSLRETALHKAARRGIVPMVSELTTIGKADVNIRDEKGMTALHHAAGCGHAAISAELITVGKASADIRDNKGATALHHAAGCGHAATVTELLTAGEVDSNVRDADNETALHRAAYSGHTDVVEVLLTIGKAYAQRTGRYGDTALHLAAAKGNTATVTKILTTAEIDAHAMDRYGSTALHHAADSGHVATVVELLIAAKVDPNIQNDLGQTALHLAAERGRTNVVDALITIGGADPNIPNIRGRTALHKAASAGKTKTVSYLLAKSDAILRTKLGLTAL